MRYCVTGMAVQNRPEYSINLGEAIKGLEVQQADPATIALPFDERMQRLVDYIYQEKYNGKIQRLIKSAKLRFPQANRQGSHLCQPRIKQGAH